METLIIVVVLFLMGFVWFFTKPKNTLSLEFNGIVIDEIHIENHILKILSENSGKKYKLFYSPGERINFVEVIN
jgi:hypothetical protein